VSATVIAWHGTAHSQSHTQTHARMHTHTQLIWVESVTPIFCGLLKVMGQRAVQSWTCQAVNNLDADFDEQVVEGKMRVVGNQDGDFEPKQAGQNDDKIVEDGDSAGMLAAQLTRLSESVAEATAAFKIVSDDEDSGPMTESKYQQTQKENAELRGLVQHVSTQLRDLQALSQKVAYLQECRYVRSSPCMCGSGVSLQLQVASLLIWCT